MASFAIPTLTTDRLRLRAFRASDLDAYAAMRGNPEVVRYLGTGRTSTRVEVWRMMAAFLGQWALRGYGVWACEKIDGGAFIGSVGIFRPLDWPEPEIIYRSTDPFGGRVSRPKRRVRPVTGCSSIFPCRGSRASFGRTITHQNASPNGSERFTSAHPSGVVPLMSTGCTTKRPGIPESAEIGLRAALVYHIPV